MSILIKGVEIPKDGEMLFLDIYPDGKVCIISDLDCRQIATAVPVPPHGRLRKRIVYRGEVYNALESARVNALDGILTDRYKDGFHDGLKRALEILADEVEDAPTIIPAEEEL